MLLLTTTFYAQNSITMLGDEVEHQYIQTNFSADKFDMYLVTERIANISDGEIYWIKENIDTFSIKTIHNDDYSVTYEVKESKDDWMDLMYDPELYDSIPNNTEFPNIIYTKNKSTKNIHYPDSCLLTNTIQHHLSNRIKLLRQVEEFSAISTWERLIRQLENCKIGNYNLLQNSKNIIHLDNYIIPINEDTIRYKIKQQEHFGIEVTLAVSRDTLDNGNTLIQLYEYEDTDETKNHYKELTELYSHLLSPEDIKAHIEIDNSVNTSNQTFLELDMNNSVIRLFSKRNLYKKNKRKGREYRFYNYEIKRINSR